MSGTPTQVSARRTLRLVYPDQSASLSQAEGRRAVERETRAAAKLADEDARRIVAMRASELIEGGNAAILRRSSRERIVRLAVQMGLRPFDANLIMAIVQDGARRGETVAHEPVRARLAMIPSQGAKVRKRVVRRAGAARQSTKPALGLGGLATPVSERAYGRVPAALSEATSDSRAAFAGNTLKSGAHALPQGLFALRCEGSSKEAFWARVRIALGSLALAGLIVSALVEWVTGG